MKTKLTLTAAAALAAILTFAMWRPGGSEVQVTAPAPALTVDGRAVDFVITQLSADGVDAGGRRYRLSAARLVRYRDRGDGHLERPRLVFHRGGEAVRETSADHGAISADGKQIKLRGRVRVRDDG